MSKDPDWTSWQVLDAALDTGSIAAAARRLGLSHATVRNRIETLEHVLRTTLFLRTNNGLQPTDEALALARPLVLMRSTAEGLVRAAAGKPGTVAGTVRVSTSVFVGTVVLPTMLGRLRERHPDLSIALVPDNASLDLNMREADVALRMHRPTGDGLVATKVGTVPLGFYAARSYVERRGMPSRAEDLPDHDLIGPDRAEYDRTLAEGFLPALAKANYVLRTDNHAAILTAVRAGLGVGVLQRPVADADPALLAVLPDRDVERIETFVTVHRDLRGAPSIDAVFRWLVEEFRRYLRGGDASG